MYFENVLKFVNNVIISVVIFCPNLFAPTSGEKNSSDSTCGSVVELSCNEGFQLSGSARVVCQRDGTWDNPDVVCEGMSL